MPELSRVDHRRRSAGSGLEAQGKTLADADGFDWPAVMEGFKKLCAMSYTDAHAELQMTPDGSPDACRTFAGDRGSDPRHNPRRARLWRSSKAATPIPSRVSIVTIRRRCRCASRAPVSCSAFRRWPTATCPTPHLPSIEALAQGQIATKPYDPNVDASRQEMRSFVCGQCHVEYYCGPKETLLFPWAKGLKVEQIESFYDDHKFPNGERFYDFAARRDRRGSLQGAASGV